MPNKKIVRIVGMISELNSIAERRKTIVDQLWITEDYGEQLRIKLMKELKELV